MPCPKKNSYKEFDNEKQIPAARKFPTPTITFLMVRPLKWEIIWTGGLPHLSRLPHLPDVPHFHVNMPLVWSRPNILCTDIIKGTMSQGYYW